jgi:hypothetical protein
MILEREGKQDDGDDEMKTIERADYPLLPAG